MLNSSFIPNVPPNISNSLNSMQNSVNSINNSFSSINSRLTTLEKNVNADVLKATESLALANEFINISGNTFAIPLTRDSSSYNKIIIKISAFTIKGVNSASQDVPAQNITIGKSGSAGVIFGISYPASNSRGQLCLGSRTGAIADKSSFVTKYYTSTLNVTATSDYYYMLYITPGVVTIEYY